MVRVMVTALVLGFLLGLGPTVEAAPPAVIPVAGVSDLHAGQVGGTIVPDRAGNLHLRQAAFQGDFALHGAGVTIVGTQTLVLTGVLDATLSGPVAGRFTVTALVNGQHTTLWDGTIHGVIRALSFTGRAVARGAGPSAGQHLTLLYQERPATPDNPNPEVFDLTGFIVRLD